MKGRSHLSRPTHVRPSITETGRREAFMSFKVLIPGFLLFAGSSLFAQQTMTCSSDDMHRHYCGADTRGGVQIARQRSDATCRQGYSWGYDRRGVWVDHGCRADFVVGNSYGANGANNGYGYGRDDRYHDRDRDGY